MLPCFLLQLIATGSTDNTVRTSHYEEAINTSDVESNQLLTNMYLWTQVKLWDLSNNQPSCVASLNPNLVCTLKWIPSLCLEGITPIAMLLTGFLVFQGAIFSVSFSNDSPFLLACGGSKGKLKVSTMLPISAVCWKLCRLCPCPLTLSLHVYCRSGIHCWIQRWLINSASRHAAKWIRFL